MNGYVLIARGIPGKGECGILSGPPSYPVVTGKPGPSPTPPGPSPPPTPPTPAPPSPPGPSPGHWVPCHSGACCNPHAAVPQYCPGHILCGDCGTDACQCPDAA